MLQDASYDFIAEARSYQSNSHQLIDMIMDRARELQQHHIKIDFNISDDRRSTPQKIYTVEGSSEISLSSGGILPVFTPHVKTYNKGIYAFSIGRSKTVYVGANNYHNRRNQIYHRVIRFGRAIYNSEYIDENHSAGRKYRALYGEDTSELYISFLFYSQFTAGMKDLMSRLNLDYSDIETLLIKKFSSRYLLNSTHR